jgi:hypothetical protein
VLYVYNSIQFYIIYVPSQGQLQTRRSVDKGNYSMDKHNIKSSFKYYQSDETKENKKTTVLWNVTPSRLAVVHRHFRGTWWGHLHGHSSVLKMEAKKLFGKTLVKTPLLGPWCWCEANINVGLSKMGVDWIRLARNRVHRRALVKTVLNLRLHIC